MDIPFFSICLKRVSKFFLLVKFHPKMKTKIQNSENWFCRFSVARSEEKKSKIHQIHILGFHCVAKTIEQWLKICMLFLVYSQIWLNLPGLLPLFLHLPMLITTLDANKNSYKKHWHVLTWFVTSYGGWCVGGFIWPRGKSPVTPTLYPTLWSSRSWVEGAGHAIKRFF
jgi:hypothetical protein